MRGRLRVRTIGQKLSMLLWNLEKGVKKQLDLVFLGEVKIGPATLQLGVGVGVGSVCWWGSGCCQLYCGTRSIHRMPSKHRHGGFILAMAF